jgi:hypothetical protein
MKKPPASIKVKAIKYDTGIVRVELVNIPEHIKFERLREEKKKMALEKKVKVKPVKEVEKPAEESKDVKEKEEASKEETQKIAKMQAKQEKHVSKDKGVKVQRKALAK